MSEFNDVKRALSLEFDKGNRAQYKIKRLKGSKSAYLGQITKTVELTFLMSEPDNGNMSTRSATQFSYKMKDSLRYISGVIGFTRRSFRLQGTSFRAERTSCKF